MDGVACKQAWAFITCMLWQVADELDELCLFAASFLIQNNSIVNLYSI
jgi:hypothetical protein